MANWAIGVKMAFIERNKGQDPVLKGKKGNCRIKMDKGFKRA